MIIQNRSKIGYFLVNTCARRVFPEEAQKKRRIRTAAAVAGAIAVMLLILQPSDRFRALQSRGIQGLMTIFSQKGNQEIGRPDSQSKPQTYNARIAASDFPDLNRGESERDPLPAKKEPASTSELPDEKKTANSTAAENNNPTASDRESSTLAPVTGEAPSKKVAESVPQLASAEISPPKVLPAPTSEATYSAILGQLTLKRNETLSRIIQRVYGGYSSRYFKSFIIANPDIEDPDRVEVGQIVSLPAIPVMVKPPDIPVWWVKIEEKDSLEAAYNFLRDLPENAPAVRLIPYWNPANGTKFALLLNTAFKNEQAARSELEKMPASMVSNPTILSLWDQGTVYFANPYFKVKN